MNRNLTYFFNVTWTFFISDGRPIHSFHLFFCFLYRHTAAFYRGQLTVLSAAFFINLIGS